jgi:uncharacterized membrane protein
MAKKRAKDSSREELIKATKNFGSALQYLNLKDKSAEMRRNTGIAERQMIKKWNKYQDSLVSDAKKNRRQP